MSPAAHLSPGSHGDIPYDAALELISRQLISADVSFGHGTIDAQVEANWLISAGCGLSPDQVDLLADFTIPSESWSAMVSLLDRRIRTRQPMAYLLGEAWFAGYRFSVDNRVVVPRSHFAEWLPDRFAPLVQADQVHSILDLCCGSGCIGIVAALEFPEAKVMLSDLSNDALDVARQNIRCHGVSHRVTIHQGNGLEGIDRCFDLILCNPPYVASSRMDTLPPEYRAEPTMGLEAGADGLDFIAVLLENAHQYLNPGGTLIVEAGSAGDAVLARWPLVPFTWLWTQCEEPVLFMLSAEELARYDF